MAALRVAIAGAGGIGRHHAKWHAQAGSDVVAVLGRRAELLPDTTRQLRDLFGFQGRGYTDFEELLTRERPDIVDICAPNEIHFDLAVQALDAGCHVLCEKPLVWASSGTKTLTQARALHDQAKARELHLGMCSQYATSLAQFTNLCPSAEPSTCDSFESEMETLSRGQRRDAESIWVDMGPHPLSLILSIWPTARLVEGTVQAEFAQGTAAASFAIESDGHRCNCRVVVRDRDEGPLIRRFSFAGDSVDLGGRQDESGVYRSVMTRKGVDDLGDDFMLLLIQQFTRVVLGDESSPLVSSSVAIRNLEFQTTILAAT
jgi:predicted dehydrogenase